ncbi:hypothetical protein BB558_001577 [Smittium angustum]|uniref:Uncharacterized protein n=1 Tax=Smittium angustum TaxID=133377 RepID=A0A2U1JB14_SMIAN|nr:hypothetical protein BB558_001577 [Smittium angustum]
MINTTINNNNTSFGNLSPFSKSKKAKMLYDYVVGMSGNAPEELLNYFFHSNNLEKNSDQKSNILALVAGTYSRAEILGLGFKMSKTQHSSAKKKARDNNFLLSKRQKRSHIQKIEADPISVVEEYLKKNSRCYQIPAELGKATGATCIINENPNTRLGLSNFYTLCPRNFKKGKKGWTCALSAPKEKPAPRKSREWAHHMISKRVGGGPVEIGSAFYSKSQISDLGFATVYKDPEGVIKYKYFNYLSKVLSHDAKYVSECLSDLFNNEFFCRFNRIHLWSDSGPHFRSQELLYSVFVDLISQTDIVFTLNYFCEYRGKSIVDGHFGKLSIEVLKETFEQAAARFRLVYKNSVDVVFRIYLQVIPRDVKCRYLVDGFKAYMSYGMRNDQLVGCPLSTLNPLEYIDLNVKINEKKDTRQTKYLIPQNEVSTDDVDPVMGSQSVSTQNSRLTLIDHIFGADSMNVDDCLL